MSAKSILEADGKAILSYHLTRSKPIKPSPLAAPPHSAPPKLASLYFPPDCSPKAILDAAETTYPFLLAPGARFVAKPDQLIKRRGKLGLLTLNKPWSEARAWVEERACKEIDVEGVKGVLRSFLVEPFVPHKGEEEYYINIHSVREVSFPHPALLIRNFAFLVFTVSFCVFCFMEACLTDGIPGFYGVAGCSGQRRFAHVDIRLLMYFQYFTPVDTRYGRKPSTRFDQTLHDIPARYA